MIGECISPSLPGIKATSSNFCEEVFSSATEHAEDLTHNIVVILQDQDVRQRHHPGEQNRNDECYGVDPTGDFDEEQYNIQSLSLDWATNMLYLCLLVIWILLSYQYNYNQLYHLTHCGRP